MLNKCRSYKFSIFKISTYFFPTFIKNCTIALYSTIYKITIVFLYATISILILLTSNKIEISIACNFTFFPLAFVNSYIFISHLTNSIPQTFNKSALIYKLMTILTFSITMLFIIDCLACIFFLLKLRKLCSKMC